MAWRSRCEQQLQALPFLKNQPLGLRNIFLGRKMQVLIAKIHRVYRGRRCLAEIAAGQPRDRRLGDCKAARNIRLRFAIGEPLDSLFLLVPAQ